MDHFHLLWWCGDCNTFREQSMVNSSTILYLEHIPAWMPAYQTWQAESLFPVRRVGYSLRDLTERGLINEFMFNAFCASTGLSDMSWHLLWVDQDKLPDDQSITNAVQCAEGVLI